jgi:hypothetical protein
LTYAVALTGENSDLLCQVRVLQPARRDNIGNIQDVLMVQPGDASLQPRPNLSSQLRRLAGCRVPRPRQVRQIPERQKVILLPAGREIKFSIGQLRQHARLAKLGQVRGKVDRSWWVGQQPGWRHGPTMVRAAAGRPARTATGSLDRVNSTTRPRSQPPAVARDLIGDGHSAWRL